MTRLRRVGRVVVTGVNGFVGRHLVRELGSQGIAVVGVGREPAAAAAEGVDEYVEADLTSTWPGLPDVDGVVHLAGLSAVGPSFADPQLYIEHNSRIVTLMAERLLEQASRARALIVSSGAVYDAHQEQPLTEESRLGHSSPYVVSKLLVESQAAYYAGRGLDVVVARPFNHLGPGQGSGFLVPDLAQGLVEAARSGHPVPVGDLDTRRDYTDVRDVVRAYALLISADGLGDRVFNVCSGRSRSGLELFEMLRRATGQTDAATVVDASRGRPGDPRDVRGSGARLAAAVGWRPQIDLETSVADFVRDFRG